METQGVVPSHQVHGECKEVVVPSPPAIWNESGMRRFSLCHLLCYDKKCIMNELKTIFVICDGLFNC